MISFQLDVVLIVVVGRRRDRFMENEYIIFEERSSQTGVTKIIDLIAIQSKIKLGEIKWFGAWRKYAFFPNENTIYDKACLETITSKLNQLMEDRKNGK